MRPDSASQQGLGAPDSPPAVTAPHILVVDDDRDVRELLLEYLGTNDMRVTAVARGSDMIALFDREGIDLVVLDLRLPGEDGMRLARQLRDRAAVPIVLLTGKADEADRVMGLELGADDYVTKPFSPRELLARIRAVLRRYQTQMQPPSRADGKRRAFRFAGWELNLRTRKLVAPDGHKLELGNREFNLLAALCGAPQRVLSRDQLLGLSRLHDAEVYDRAIDVQISRLRHRIEADPSRPQLIVTERAAGYIFNVPVETLY